MAKRRSASEYALFLERIPEDTRNEIANNIKDSPVEDLNDFAYMCSGLIAEIVRGNIPPTVADAAQPYEELMYTAIVTSGKSEKTNRAAAFTKVIGRLQEAADNAKRLEEKDVVDASFEGATDREPIHATSLAA